MRKMSADECFISWKTLAKEVGKVRYTSTERMEQLDVLCDMFRTHGVEYDDAKFYKKKVVEFMVTKEGMKGNGRHKGWKEATEEDFIGILTGFYNGEFQIVNDTTATKKTKTRKVEYYGGIDYLERAPLMVAWTKYKFENLWTESICLEAHKIGSPLWQAFDKEVMRSKWAKSGPRPDWARNVY